MPPTCASMCSYSVSTDERRLLKEVPTSVHSMRASALLGPFVMKRARGRPKRLTRSAERYRRYARQCVEMAPTFQDKKARRMLLRFAQGWSRLEHLTEPNRHIMSDEFGQPGSDREGHGWESVLNRCRVLAAKIANELRNKRPEHFVDKLSLADIHFLLERAADVLSTMNRSQEQEPQDHR
jgi:hypothetical protein